MNDTTTQAPGGMLDGLRVIEFAGIGPGPFAAMLLADLGADVIRIDRPGTPIFGDPALDTLNRGKRSILLDLKSPQGQAIAMRLIGTADASIEGYRPKVMERLGLGPAQCMATNPGLVYGRVTGWGQAGPLADRPGHDLNYLALTGALHAIGEQGGAPVVPLNLVADFGGGGMLLAYGLMSALWRVARGGAGQVVDAAMIDGASSLMAMTYAFQSMGLWAQPRGSNLLDGGAPHYSTYACADGGWLAVAALEPQFLARLLAALDIAPQAYGDAHDRAAWPAQRQLLEGVFITAPRDSWAARLQDLDVCVTPVLSMSEAPLHPHNVARATFAAMNGAPGYFQPAACPRFGAAAAPALRPPCLPGEHSAQILAELDRMT